MIIYLEELVCLGGNNLGGGINVPSVLVTVVVGGALIDITGGIFVTAAVFSSGVSGTVFSIDPGSSLPAYNNSSGLVGVRRRAYQHNKIIKSVR